ncbi:hypothetical protein [Variovorax beijingensis]|uniref:hypothetical protein n=1 Tax=Variovorax beijingensis TaxID=2496117 RepID=UPI003F697786
MSKDRRWWISAGAALAVACAVGGVTLLRPSTLNEPGAGMRQVTGADSEARLRDAEAKIEQLTEALGRPTERPAMSAPAPQLSALPEDSSQRQATARKVADNYKVVYDGNARDAVFEAKALRQAERALEAEALAMVSASPRDLSVDCRGQICRLDAEFPNASDASEWATYYVMALGDVLPSSRTFMLPGQHGATRMQLYLFSPKAAGTMQELDRRSW